MCLPARLRPMKEIDRRNFLGLFSAAALAAIAPPERLVRLYHTSFDSPAFGFSMEIPPGWCHWSVEDVIRNREKLVYVEERRSEDALTPTPLAAFSRYKEPFPDFNPGFCIYGDRRAAWMGNDLVTFTNSIAAYFSQIVRNSQITRPASITSVFGSPSARTTLIYDVACNDGFRHRVADELVIVFHREHLLLFQFEQSAAGGESAEAEFKSVESSLRFA